MSRDAFVAEYRRRLLGFLAECYCTRKLSPSDMGMELDRHYNAINAMLGSMYDAIKPAEPIKAAQPPVNGQQRTGVTK